GNTGVCLSIINSRELGKIRQIERMVQVPFHKVEIPTGKDVCRKQFFHFMEKLLSADISHGDYETYVPMLEEKFADVSKEEILKRVASKEFSRFLKYYENAEDLNVRVSVREREPAGRHRERIPIGGDRLSRPSFSPGNGDFVKLFVNLGTKDGFYKASFLQFILDMSELDKAVLGRIDMKEMNSWIEVEKNAAHQMIKALDGKKYKGRSIRKNDDNSR